MKILITGGAGFIGSNLIEYLLLHSEYELTCIDNFDPLYDPKIKKNNILPFVGNTRFKFKELDIRSKSLLSALDETYDAIVHLAAKAGVRNSVTDPIGYADVNINGTINLLEFASKKKIPRFIFGSSSSVYGRNPKQPWKENDELLPISPYAASKCAAEKFGFVYSELNKLQFVGLRFFTVYGPRQRPDLAINKFFHAISKDLPLDIYGDGSSIRDYTYVEDIVRAITAAITAELPIFSIMNISSGNPIKLLDLVKYIENITCKKAILKFMPKQSGDVDSTFGDITLARKLINYQPSVELKDGLNSYFTYINKV